MKAPHYKYTFFLLLLLCFFLLFINSNCHRKQVATSSNTEKVSTDKSRVLYLTIESALDSITGEPNMKIIKQQLVQGKLNEVAYPELNPGQWQISLLNASGKRIDSMIMNDPHIEEVEIPNEKEEFETRKIRLVKTEIAVRFNYSSTINEIEIVELQEDEKKKTFLKTKLIL